MAQKNRSNYHPTTIAPVFIYFRQNTRLDAPFSFRIEKPAPGGSVLLPATLCGRLGQALKSDTYGDFRLGQLTQVNIVVVSG